MPQRTPDDPELNRRGGGRLTQALMIGAVIGLMAAAAYSFG